MEKKINIMSSLSEVMITLEERGDDNEFTLAPNGHVFHNAKSNQDYQAADLKIIKVYRFEGESDPGDTAALYLIEAKDGTRGYIVDAYGTYSADTLRFAEALKAIPIDQPSAHHQTDSESDERGGEPLHGSDNAHPADERFGAQHLGGLPQPQPNKGDSKI